MIHLYNNNLKISYGEIIETQKEKNKLKYTAGTEKGSSGAPIILTNEFKVIGLHKGGSKYDTYEDKINTGIYLDKIIQLIQKPNHP